MDGTLTVSGGTVYPGGNGSIGTLVITKDFNMTGGTLSIDSSLNPQGLIDQVQVTNNLTLQSAGANAGTLTVNTVNPPPPAGTYVIITYGTLTGDFATKNLNYPGGFYVALPNGGQGAYQLLVPGGARPRIFSGGQEGVGISSGSSPFRINELPSAGSAPSEDMSPPVASPPLLLAEQQWNHDALFGQLSDGAWNVSWDTLFGPLAASLVEPPP